MEALTLKVRGEGGGEWDMDVPAAGSHAREVFDARIANGQLQVIGDDGELLSPITAAELVAAGGGVAPADDRKVRGGPADVPAPAATADVVEPPRVGAGSGKDAWAAYAASKGIDPADMNRAELIAAVDALAESGEG